MHFKLVASLPYRVALIALGIGLFAATACGTSVYVDAAAPPGGNGQSWSTAFQFLQDGLAYASVPANGVNEVRVGKGTYKPDRSQAAPNGTGDRNATFHMIEGVAIRGGYAGFGAPNPDRRDLEQFTTIFSGDLFGDDLPPQNSSHNSFHVVTSETLSAATTLDGVTVTAGFAGPDDLLVGGGMLIKGGNPIVLKCRFVTNVADDGGGGGAGIIGGGSPTFQNCSFNNNYTVGGGCCVNNGGGAVRSNASNPSFINCLFDHNRYAAEGRGGAILAIGGSVALINCTFNSNGFGGNGYGGAISSANCLLFISGCTFTANGAKNGGALTAGGGEVTIQDSVFYDHYAEEGGVIWLGSPAVVRRCVFKGNVGENGGVIQIFSGGSMRFDACQFLGNRATLFWGGAIANNSTAANTMITNCVFSGNRSTSGIDLPGGAIYNRGQLTAVNCTFGSNIGNGGAIASENGSVQLDNCIVFHNSPSHFNITGGTFEVTYSDVQGGWAGEGNIDADPLFIRQPHPGPDGMWATGDDDPGDLRVSPNSPVLNAGSNAAIPAGVNLDVLGNPRIQNMIVDMGAYEGPHCPADAAPTPLGDGSININDLLLIINSWGPCGAGPCFGDIAPSGGDRIVNVADMLAVISNWGACP